MARAGVLYQLHDIKSLESVPTEKMCTQSRWKTRGALRQLNMRSGKVKAFGLSSSFLGHFLPFGPVDKRSKRCSFTSFPTVLRRRITRKLQWRSPQRQEAGGGLPSSVGGTGSVPENFVFFAKIT